MWQVIIQDKLGDNYVFYVETEDDARPVLRNSENFKFIANSIEAFPVPHKESKFDSRFQLPLFLDITNKIIPLINNLISGNPRGQLLIEKLPLLTQAIYRAITTSMSKDDVISDLNDIFSILEKNGIERAELNNISRIIIQNLYEKKPAEDAKAANEKNFEEKFEKDGKSSDDKPGKVIGKEKFNELIKEKIKVAVNERIRIIVVETISKELLTKDSKIVNLILNTAQEAVKEIAAGIPEKLVSIIGAQEILKMAQEVSIEITMEIIEEIKAMKEIREEDQVSLNENRHALTSSGLFKQRNVDLAPHNESSMNVESSPKI